MKTDRELMQQALEALEFLYGWTPDTDPVVDAAITALRERLAQPEQEPVWIQPNHLQLARRAPFLCRVEPKQRDDFVPLYTASPQRKPLTEEKIKAVAASIDPDDQYLPKALRQLARAIERAHGIGEKPDAA